MQVIATATGYDGQVIRKAEEEFEMPEGSKGSWFKPTVPAPKPGKPKADKPSDEPLA